MQKFEDEVLDRLSSGESELFPQNSRTRSPAILTRVLLAAAIAMTENAHAAPAEVTGMVVYRQRIALPPEAVVHVRLEDVSRPMPPQP